MFPENRRICTRRYSRSKFSRASRKGAGRAAAPLRGAREGMPSAESQAILQPLASL